MELNNEQRIGLSRCEVWDALNDPEILKVCIPLCDSVQKINDREFHVSMVAAVGPVRAKFNVKLQYTEMDPPASCCMIFDGQGGPSGFGKGEARVTLTADNQVTVLRYQVKAQVGGKLAQIGSRLIDATARKIAEEFFAKFNAAVVATRPAVAEPAPEEAFRLVNYTILWIAAALAAMGFLWGWLH